MTRKNVKNRPDPTPPPVLTGTHKILADIIVEQMGVDLSEVTRDASFFDDLGFDSLDIVEVIMQLEEELKLDIDEEQFVELKTVGEVLPKLDALIAAQKAAKAK